MMKLCTLTHRHFGLFRELLCNKLELINVCESLMLVC